jgi:hypothetical protein
VVNESYPLSPLEHRITTLREHLRALVRNSERASGEERTRADAVIADLSKELDHLISERHILARDSD